MSRTDLDSATLVRMLRDRLHQQTELCVKAEDENAKLRNDSELLRRMLQAKRQETHTLMSENARLRELLLKSFELMHRGGLTTGAYGPCMELFEEAEDIGVIVPFMSELGIEDE